jgi:hypothetical protein
MGDTDFSHWTEQASFSAYGRIWRALEDMTFEKGSIAFLDDRDQAVVLDKRLEPVFSQATTPYLGLDQKLVALAPADLLADKLLASGDDPNLVEVRDAAPPPASEFKAEDLGARLAWTFFVGTRHQNDTMPVTARGSTRTYHVDQAFGGLSIDADLVKRRHEGLLGSSLPAIVKVFPLGDGRYYETIIFGDVEDTGPSIVQTWHRSRLVEDGKATKVVYAHSYPACPPVRTPPEPAAFYRALLAFAAAWEDELQGMAQTQLPDDWGHMVRHAFIKEIMVRPGGVYPKYGAVDRDYMGSEYDGFQDTLTSSLYANLEWGRFKQARDVLDNYFTSFVRPNGDVNMRGPETGQYGLTLALLARYLRYTGDIGVLARHADKIAATAGLLIEMHEQSLRLAPSEPGYGLVHGWNESDSCLFPDPSVWWKPYFANSAFAARGLKEIAAVWPLISPKDAGLARTWSAHAAQLQARVVEAVRQSVRRDLTPAYVPPLPGVSLTFRQSLASEKPSPQQWPHRAYAELLQAQVLPPELANLVIDAMRGHGATSLGVVANVGDPDPRSRDILGFISYGYAKALLELDRIEEYLLFLYAHRFHAHTPGSWTAGEVCDTAGGLPLFCIPAQLTIPLLVRWQLVFESEDHDQLHLGRAIPRTWLGSGRPISIQGAPTRWGKVDLSLKADMVARSVIGSVRLAGQQGPAETLLRVRLPAHAKLAMAKVNGAPAEIVGQHGDTLRLNTRETGLFELEARFDV